MFVRRILCIVITRVYMYICYVYTGALIGEEM